VQTIVRPRRKGGKRSKTKPKQKLESARWKKGIEIAEERVAGRCALVHVMDRECDSYALWAELIEAKCRRCPAGC